MKMRGCLLLLASAVLVCLSAPAVAQWGDNFDAYDTDISLHGVGGWKGWDNSPAWTAYTRDEVVRSAPNAVEIEGNSDLIHEYDADSGDWTYTAWQYIPLDYNNGTGSPPVGSHFILQNTYNDGGPYSWSVQLDFDGDTGLLVGDCGAENNVSMPYVRGEWVEIRVDIFLDPEDDWTQVYYNGTLLDDPALADHPVLGGGYSWSDTVFGGGGGVREIGAVDLFANGASPVYYDDMSLVPEPASCLLLALAAALGLRRR
jgi:hypothetical protein